MGYLPQAMVNYLALLGWGDGTENEFFTIDDLGMVSKLCFLSFSLKYWACLVCLATWCSLEWVSRFGSPMEASQILLACPQNILAREPNRHCGLVSSLSKE